MAEACKIILLVADSQDEGGPDVYAVGHKTGFVGCEKRDREVTFIEWEHEDNPLSLLVSFSDNSCRWIPAARVLFFDAVPCVPEKAKAEP